MATALKTIELPEETIAGLDALVAAGHAETREALVADLVAREAEQAEKQKAFDDAIEEGFASGFVTVTTEELRERLRMRREAFDAAIDEGLASGSSGVTLDEVMAEARLRHGRS